MKKLLIAVLALVGFSAASFAQTTPATKKNEPSKVQVVKKANDKKQDAKTVAIHKTVKTTSPAIKKERTTPVAKAGTAQTKPAVTKKNAAGTVKKDGSPDKRYAANKPLRKDGTPDMRYKANKKHS